MPDWTALLQTESGVIDLRERAAFDEKHIRQSLHAAGIPGLLDRFSWLPPPKTENNKGLRLIAICSKEDKGEVKRRLNRWSLIAIIDEDDEEDFWKQAETQGLLVRSSQPDVPALLFEPSAIVEVALKACEEGKPELSRCTVLDLGCGAARDIAWIVRRKSSMTWIATGLDNLHATIQRAELLKRDMHLGNAEGSHIERLVWAQATDQGTLQALRFGPTSKSKGIAVERGSHNDNDSLQSFANTYLPHQTYDLILLIRFLPRSLLMNLPSLSHSKSIIAISHFTTIEDEADYASPDSSKRFEVADVNVLIEQWGDQWRLLYQFIHRAEDGRPIRSALFQRL